MRFNVCQECGTKLRRVAIFCSQCGQPSCCWSCHKQHLLRHDEKVESVSSSRVSEPSAAASTPIEPSAAG